MTECQGKRLSGLVRKADMEEWLVENVMALYEGAQTEIRTADGITSWF